MTPPTCQDALLRHRVPRELVTRARHAPFRVQTTGSVLTVTPSSGFARQAHRAEFEHSLPLLDGADRTALAAATFNSSYLRAIVDDLCRGGGDGATGPAGAAWERYGRALHRAMAEVLEELPEAVRPHALETADYWISVGPVIGLEHPPEAQRLLGLIEANEEELADLSHDAASFLREALG